MLADAVTSSPGISFALIRSAPRPEMLQLVRSGASVFLDLHFPTDQPGVFLKCRIDLGSRDLSRLRRSFHQTANHRSSALAIAGMTLLLAVCGWVVGGTEGVQRALTGGAPRRDGSAIAHETIFRWFGARLLLPTELPGLFDVLAEVCHRAGLSQLPHIYCVPASGDMNAYALGGPEGAAIILTEGLLRGMTRDEIAGILAHRGRPYPEQRYLDDELGGGAAPLDRMDVVGRPRIDARPTWQHGHQPAACRTAAGGTFNRRVASFGIVAHPRT